MSEGSFHRILFACIAAVVLGVVLEGYEHWEDFRKRGWRPIVPKVGFAILVLGLAGELFIQPFIDSAENSFRIDAKQRIASLHTELGEAHLEIARLTKTTELARAEGADANARAAEANQKAEQEHLARVKIEERLISRHLRTEQVKRLIAKLEPFADQEAIVVGDPISTETANISQQLVKVLSDAHLNVTPSIDERYLGCMEPSNILLWAGPDETVGALAEVLASELNADGEVNKDGLRARVITSEYQCVSPDARLPTPIKSGKRLTVNVCPK